ncbi:MAG: 4Fe-4S dicluster domain-containing protein [Tannerella sp.]|jgi:ferredoxin|nr:4Fe-4S dicluster domain-containing protein [Tannerella sp.]
MLKKTRTITAILLFTLITLVFFDFTKTLHPWFGWLAKVQFVPAMLAVNVITLLLLALITLLFGRIYCSVICPLGTIQDGISNLSGRRRGKKSRFRYSAAKSWMRYGALALFIAAIVAGISSVVSLLDPYAAYGRIASNLLAPLYRLGNNLLAWFAERTGSYAFYPTDVWIKGLITFGVAVVTLTAVGILAWRNGRTYCNTICPVGTALGFLSRFSLFRLVLDAEKCTKCKRCERSCKASCIDAENGTVDYSRCVNCFNCMEKCNLGALKYVPVRMAGRRPAKPADSSTDGEMSRRSLLTIVGTFAVARTVRAQQLLHVDGGLAEIEDKKAPSRKTPLAPPGAQGLKNMKTRCTACQLCVSACPNNVLRPSGRLVTFMQPEMSYERGYCRPECTECSQVCPAGAIKPVTAADRTGISVGHAVWLKNNCVVNTDEVQCSNCERHCPAKAITLIDLNPGVKNSLKIPVVDDALCTGCGACEYLCPVRPFSAMYVEGNVRHHSV